MDTTSTGSRCSAARRRARAPRASACRCRTTATARRTSTWPRPKRSRPCRWPRSSGFPGSRRGRLAAGRPRRSVRRARVCKGSGVLLGVDVGGTFTDAVLATGETLHTGKAPSTPRDQSEGVMAAVGAVLDRAGVEAGDIERFAHGMTVATNALLEGNAARTVLIATEGFTDLIELGRQARAHLYRLCADRPAPFTPPDRRVPAPERCGPDGPLRALDDEAARATCERAAELEPEAVAVVLLHAYRHPEHEQALGKALGEHLPDAHVSLSHDVVGTFREYERAATTEVDAALGPLLARYLRGLLERAEGAGLPAPRIM